MSAYLVLGVVAVFLTILCLDKIGAKVEPEKKGHQVSLWFGYCGKISPVLFFLE